MKLIRNTVALAAALLIVACGQKGAQFSIKGNISQGEGKMLYLQEIVGNEMQVLDSVLLDKSGDYLFEQEAPNAPQFYRLSLEDQHIYFAADSAVVIGINAPSKGFSSQYTVSAGPGYNEQIKGVWLAKLQADKKIKYCQELLKQGQITYESYQDSLLYIAEAFKAPLRNELIFKDPRSPASYFALYQQTGGLLFFNILEKADAQAFRAVATAFETYYPTSANTESVRQIALQAASIKRQAERSIELEKQITKQAEVHTAPNFKLIDNKGDDCAFKNVVATHDRVLLVFTSYAADWSPQLVNQLRQIYSKNRDKSFEIVAVSVDRDIYFWQNATRTLDWINVHDKEQDAVRLYDVQQLPTFFMISSDKLEKIERIEELLWS